MIPVGIGKYQRQNAQDRVIELLKQERGNPLTVEEISFRLKLDANNVLPIINDIQHSYDLCQKNNKFYFPKASGICWLAAFGLMVVAVYTVCGIIKYYNL